METPVYVKTEFNSRLLTQLPCVQTMYKEKGEKNCTTVSSCDKAMLVTLRLQV